MRTIAQIFVAFSEKLNFIFQQTGQITNPEAEILKSVQI